MNIGSIIAGGAGACAILAFLGKGIVGMYRFFQRMGKALEAIEGRSTQLEHNGGSSMRDQVARIEKHLTEQDVVIAELQGSRRRRWLR